MEEKINKLLDLILSGIQSGAALASKELPVLVHQLVNYYVIDSLPFMSFVIFLTTFGLWRVYFWSIKNGGLKDEDEPRMWIGTILFIFHCWLGTVFIDGLKSTAQGLIAPEAFIIMKIKDHGK